VTPVYKLSASSVKGRTNYGSMLAGNPTFVLTDYESIATITPSVGATGVSFTSIPSTYKHLQIRLTYKDTTTSNQTVDLTIQFNNSSTGYAYHFINAQGSGITADGSTSQPYIDFECGGNSATGMTNMVGVGIIDLHDYASTTKNKTVKMFGGMNANATSTTHKLTFYSGLWNNTAAINRIDLNAGYSGMAAGSVFSLYGIKG
jgi:hypothetical protein